MTLPLTLGSIGDGAFDDVYALKNIYYAGSIAQWKAIDIGLDNSFGSAKLVCADKTEPFSDISGWYHDYIITCYMADIVNGRPDGTFCPEQNVTRAQFVMMLYNMGGRPEIADTSLGFADANAVSAVYAAAVKWGVKAGIVTGFTDNTFYDRMPEISRAQMATFAYRFLKLGVSADVLERDFSGRNDFRDYGYLFNRRMLPQSRLTLWRTSESFRATRTAASSRTQRPRAASPPPFCRAFSGADRTENSEKRPPMADVRKTALRRNQPKRHETAWS